jgi:hypothetical protein
MRIGVRLPIETASFFLQEPQTASGAQPVSRSMVTRGNFLVGKVTGA